MRILLIQSYTSPEEPPIYPLGIACLKTVLRDEHDVLGFDVNISPICDLERLIRDDILDVIGFSIRNIKVASQRRHRNIIEEHHEIIRLVRKYQRNSVLIAGGMGFSLFAEALMDLYLEIDIGLFGSSEVTLPALLENMDNPHKVPCIYYRKDGIVKYSFDPNKSMGSVMVKPDRSILPIEPYKSYESAIGVQTRRGCILSCIHCSDKHLLGSNVFTRPIDEVIEELRELQEVGVERIFFADQIFNIPRDYTMDLLNRMIEEKIKLKWTGWFFEGDIDRDFMALVKESGCYQVIFSPDTADEKVLQSLKKGFDALALKKTYILAKEVSLCVSYDFMLNAPGETILSLLRTLIFIIKARLHLGKLLGLHGLFLVVMRIYPHTELQNLAIKKGIIKMDDNLVEPRFYNPFPLSIPVWFILRSIGLLWRLKRIVS